MVENIEKLNLFRGSKYVHSYINNYYILVEKDLKAKTGFICRYPLSNYWIKSVLAKEYEKFLTVDLICLGVLPHKLLFDHLKKI